MVIRVYHLLAIGMVGAVLAGGIVLGRTALAEEAPTQSDGGLAGKTVTVSEIILTSPDETVTIDQEQLQAQYDGFHADATVRTAEANTRSAIPAAEAYYADNGSYAGMTIEALRDIDAGLDPTIVRVGYAKPQRYCVEATAQVEGAEPAVAHYEGPGGGVLTGPCPPA